jgi:hypothetical protein
VPETRFAIASAPDPPIESDPSAAGEIVLNPMLTHRALAPKSTLAPDPIMVFEDPVVIAIPELYPIQVLFDFATPVAAPKA